MDKNIVITTMENIINDDKIDFITGEIQNCGTSSCALVGERGSVYGIAVQLNEEEKNSFFDCLQNKKKSVKKENWLSIGEDFYPLYWGIDINMGSRLNAHVKAYTGTGALQLNKKSIENYKIIYGAIPCLNRAVHEKELRKQYPDILKTIKD